jgi:hypothetical protein
VGVIIKNQETCESTATEKHRKELLVQLRTTTTRTSWNHKIQNTNTKRNAEFDLKVHKYLHQRCGRVGLHSRDYSNVDCLPHRRTKASRKSAVNYGSSRQMLSHIETEDTRSGDDSTEPPELDKERGNWRRRNVVRGQHWDACDPLYAAGFLPRV